MNRTTLLIAVMLIAAAAPSSAEVRPNVVFILADDLGYADLGCYGQKIIRTPNLDRMASEGMRFTQHYSGSPVCAPSRCVLMTGKHSGHAFIRNNRAVKPEGQYPIPADAVTLAELFKRQGYATGGFGKWGLGPMDSTGSPLRQGFDRFFGYNCQGKAHNLYPPSLWDNDRTITLDNQVPHPPQLLPAGADPNDPASYATFIGKAYAPDLYMEQARRFIQAHKGEPFFLFVPTIIPHLALQVPEDSLAEYRGKFPDPPYPGGRGYLPHFAPRAAYAAMVTRMDREVGRIVTLIEELGLGRNTIFIFSSDNGPLNGTHQGLAGTDATFFNSAGGLRDGKGTVYEGGIRVPAIVRWKGRIQAGTTNERVTGFEDWIPTLMQLIGAGTAPQGIDGISFAPALLGKRQPPRPFLYREFPGYGGQQSVRMGDWKGVRRNLMPTGKDKDARPNLHIELYDLRGDIAESKDVSAQNPSIVAQIERIMREQHTPSPEFPLPALDALAK